MRHINLTLVGGGTGLSVLARGLKQYPINISAIVSVADDGGSTGIIRERIDMPAPGDIRNVLGALSDSETQLKNLFNYRFNKEQFDGHALGNLMLAAMFDITGDFSQSVKALSELLNVRGTVVPSTNISPKLKAIMTDRTELIGERHFQNNKKQIDRVSLIPDDIDASIEAIHAIEQADILVFGPGSLYTSIIPNLIPNGMKEAIIQSDAVKVFVVNIMTQMGETVEYSAVDHIEAFIKHVGKNVIDFAIVNLDDIDGDISNYYKENNMKVVEVDSETINAMGVEIKTHPSLIQIDKEGAVRHNNEALAELIYNIALEKVSTLQYTKE